MSTVLTILAAVSENALRQYNCGCEMEEVADLRIGKMGRRRVEDISGG